MNKVPATKMTQSSPSPDHPTQVPDKPMRSIRYMDKEIINLKKDLIRSRLLMQSAKAGRGYFTILREESAMKKKQQQLQKLKEEERNKFQPAKKLPEIQGDTMLTTYDEERFKKLGAGPFIPIYSCILLPFMPEAHIEPLFRQLCALHWLLEALTIDHTHHIMKPVITCFNTKDPGGSKSSIKKVNKDKSREQRWEHFITASKTTKFKLSVMRSTGHKPSRRASTLSLSRTSGGSSPQSSMISVNPGSDEPQSLLTQGTSSKDIEDNESSSTKPDEEPLHVYLQKLLEMVREDAYRTVMMESEMHRNAPSPMSTSVPKQNKSDSIIKEGQATHKSSEKSSTTSGESHTQIAQKKTKGRANRDIVQYKSGICSIMRAKFYSIAQEAGFCLQNKMEILVKYFDLLSKLPEDLKNYRPAKKILVKLQKFGENLDLRVRPHVLLKVLQDLRVWELCSPDIAVAIEFVREHIIHMPREDYITWLQSRINMTIRPHSTLT